jgi:hypothetical protein
MSRSVVPAAVFAGVLTTVMALFSPTAIASQSARAASAPNAAAASLSDLSVLNAVVCPTSARCVAVGSATSIFAGKSAVISAKSGAVTIGAGTVKNGALNAVACPTTSRCLAVADQQVASIKVSTGAIKQSAKLTPPKGGIMALGDIACASKKTCYGVGFEGSPSAGTAVLATISAAGKVQRITKGKGTGIGSIACPSSARCLVSIADAGKTYVQLLNKGHFGVRHPVPGSFVESISCFKGKICVALAGKRGGTVSHINEYIPLNPKTGKLGKTITLRGFNGFNIDCFTSTKCTVVGATTTSTTPAAVTVSGHKVGKAKQYTGGSFHESACADPSHCYGVGDGTTAAIVVRL